MKFKTNGFLVFDEGSTLCDPDDPQTISDETWALSADNTTITIDESVNVNILSLNESMMELGWVQSANGISYNVKRKFSLQ
jgi:hypothetical protein